MVIDMGTTNTATFTATRFEVVVCAPLSAARVLGWVETEDEAVALAEAHVGPRSWQVSITAHTDQIDTWAIRHHVWENDAVRCHGWSIWINGEHQDDFRPTL